MTKTRQCDECAWYDSNEAYWERNPCTKGHKPRFYKPHWIDRSTSWGWKRRCEDFKEAGQP